MQVLTHTSGRLTLHGTVPLSRWPLPSISLPFNPGISFVPSKQFPTPGLLPSFHQSKPSSSSPSSHLPPAWPLLPGHSPRSCLALTALRTFDTSPRLSAALTYTNDPFSVGGRKERALIVHLLCRGTVSIIPANNPLRTFPCHVSNDGRRHQFNANRHPQLGVRCRTLWLWLIQ